MPELREYGPEYEVSQQHYSSHGDPIWGICVRHAGIPHRENMAGGFLDMQAELAIHGRFKWRRLVVWGRILARVFA